MNRRTILVFLTIAVLGLFFPTGADAEEMSVVVPGDSDVQAAVEALLNAESPDEALVLVDGEIAKNPNAADYRYLRGIALMELDRLEESIEAISTAIQLDASRWNYFYDRGLAYYLMGDDTSACADWMKATELNPTYDDPYYALVVVLGEAGMEEDAMPICVEGLAAFPDSDELWRLLGNLHVMLDNYDEALAAYDRAIALGEYTAETIGPGYIVATLYVESENAEDERAGDEGAADEGRLWLYELVDGGAVITKYLGDDDRLVIPSQLNGYPVVAIGDSVFTIPEELANRCR